MNSLTINLNYAYWLGTNTEIILATIKNEIEILEIKGERHIITYSDLKEKLPLLSIATIKRCVGKLKKLGVVKITHPYMKAGRSYNCYQINYEKLIRGYDK